MIFMNSNCIILSSNKDYSILGNEEAKITDLYESSTGCCKGLTIMENYNIN